MLAPLLYKWQPRCTINNSYGVLYFKRSVCSCAVYLVIPFFWLCVSPQGHNIFCNLSSTEYSDLMQLLKQSILATDLTLYFEYARFESTVFIRLLDPHRGWLSLTTVVAPADASSG